MFDPLNVTCGPTYPRGITGAIGPFKTAVVE